MSNNYGDYKKIRSSSISREDIKQINPFLKASNRGKLNIDNVNTIVLHWTSSPSLDDSIKKLRDTNSSNYHFVIDLDGKIYQTSPLSLQVNHAGDSFGPKGRFVNPYSYAIAIVKKGPITENQYLSIVNLIDDITDINKNIEYITAHYEISPGRKNDPYDMDFNGIKNALKNNKIKVWRAGDAPYDKSSNEIRALYKPSLKSKFKQLNPIIITKFGGGSRNDDSDIDYDLEISE